MENKPRRNLIGLAGRARAGKSQLAEYMRNECGATILTVANYLKYLCCDLLNVDYDELNRMKNERDELSVKPDDRWVNLIHKRTGIGKDEIRECVDGVTITSVRQMLQFVGTDVIRKYKPSWHVDCLVEDIMSYSEDKLIIIDDIRFPDEKEAVERLGGLCFFIVRPSKLDNVSNHVSETALSWYDFNMENVLINDSTLDYFNTCFLSMYKNDFNLFMLIKLSDNPNYYTMNIRYGIEHKSESLFKRFIAMLSNKHFKETGAFYLSLIDDELKSALFEEVLNEKYEKSVDFTVFVLYNPIITENFKRYIN